MSYPVHVFESRIENSLLANKWIEAILWIALADKAGYVEHIELYVVNQ